MDQRVTELAALVDRARRLGRVVTRDSARKRKLPEQLAQPGLIQRHVGVALRVRPFEVRVGHPGWTAVPWAHDVNRVEVALLDQAVGVGVDEVQPRSRAPVTQEAGLDVLQTERSLQQWVVEEVDLSDAQVVGRAPVGVDEPELVGGEGLGAL